MSDEYEHHTHDDLVAVIRGQEAENRCDACRGSGTPVSGRPCMCRGTGKMSEAAIYLREELNKRDRELDKAEARVAEQAAEIERLKRDYETAVLAIDDLFENDHPDIVERVKLLFTRAEAAEARVAELEGVVRELLAGLPGCDVDELLAAHYESIGRPNSDGGEDE
jgi:lipopolysaccharide biosynthesis regulator YciM